MTNVSPKDEGGVDWRVAATLGSSQVGGVSYGSLGGTKYYLADAQDSVMALTNASGTVLNTYNYDVFGAIRSSTGSTANPFSFTGEQTDASTSLEYLRARYYDPATGGFASRDPVATSNRFSYVEADPVNLTDPSGLCVSQKSYDELMRKMAKLFAAAGDGKWGQYWKKVWLWGISVCNRDYNPDPPRPTPTPTPRPPKIPDGCKRSYYTCFPNTPAPTSTPRCHTISCARQRAEQHGTATAAAGAATPQGFPTPTPEPLPPYLGVPTVNPVPPRPPVIPRPPVPIPDNPYGPRP